jgi:hypothetical protein
MEWDSLISFLIGAYRRHSSHTEDPEGVQIHEFNTDQKYARINTERCLHNMAENGVSRVWNAG